MKKEIVMTKNSSKEQSTWNKSIRKDDKEESIRVEELMNGGYIVEIRKEEKDKKGNWNYDTKKYFSKVNPLADDKDDDSINELAKTLLGENTGLTQ